MPAPPTGALGRARTAVAALGLLVPLVVDPFAGDTQGLKVLALGLTGGAALLLGALAVLTGRREPGPTPWTERALVALLAWAALSLTWAENPYQGLMRLVLAVGMIGLARAVRHAVRDTRGARRWALGLLAVGLVAAAADAWLMTRRATELDASAAKHASVLFVHNNMAAAYATMLVPIAFGFALGARNLLAGLPWLLPMAALLLYVDLLDSRAGTLGALLAVAVVGWLFLAFRLVRRLEAGGSRGRSTGMVLAGTLAAVGLALAAGLVGWTSRGMSQLAAGGLVGAGLALAAVAQLARRPWLGALARRSRTLGVIALVVVAMLPLSDRAWGAAKDRFYWAIDTLSLDFQDTSFRMLVWQKTAALVREDPWRGVGAGNWVVEYPRYERLVLAKPHAHNDALQVLAELGVPGLFLFAGLLVAGAAAALRALAASEDGVRYAVVSGVIGSLVVFVVAGVFEVPFALGATAASLAVLLGIVSALDPRTTVAMPMRGVRRGAAGIVAVVALLTIGYVVQRLPASALLARAEEARAEGEADAAVELYGRVAAMGTGVPAPHVAVAELRLEAGDPQGAHEALVAARELWPHGPELCTLEARVLLELGRDDEAVDALRRAVTSSPGDAGVVYQLVMVLERVGRLREAIDLLEHQVRTSAGVRLDAYRRLALLWEQVAEGEEGDARLSALAAARHYVALLIEHDEIDELPALDERLAHLTHRLQSAAPLDHWWSLYRRFLANGGLRMPSSALYTSIGPEGVKLYPGWEEAEGPPRPWGR